MKSCLSLIVLIFCSHVWAADCEAEKQTSEYKPHYAKLFSIRYYKDFKIIESLTDKFIVADRAKLSCTTKLPIITNNTKRFIATSTTHLPFLKMLSLEKTLVGFQGVNYIYNPDLKALSIKDINFQLNPEELLSLKPDLVMAYSANLASTKRLVNLRKLNIPVVLNRDFEEKHPLARAEWLVFSASFFSKDSEAQKLFKEIEKSYNQTKWQAGIQSRTPTLALVGDIQNGKWATCGGQSDLAILIQDAGGKLLLQSEKSETQYFNLEKILSLKETPDVWLTQNTWTDLTPVKKDSRYKKFSTITIFNNNNKMNSKGFNDFWEYGVARPDLLLKDLYAIFHPERNLKSQLIWYKELK